MVSLREQRDASTTQAVACAEPPKCNKDRAVLQKTQLGGGVPPRHKRRVHAALPPRAAVCHELLHFT